MSLSNPKIIQTLNAHYAPVYLTNEDYADSGSATKEEKAELRRIQREGLAKGLSVGSVHAFVLAPDGSVRDSLHTVEAAKAPVMLAMLERNATALNVPAGQPVVAPRPEPPPACKPGEIQLSVVARYLEKRDGALVPVQSESGDWSALPSQDWIALDSAVQAKLVQAGKFEPGKSWMIDAALANKILTHFYPPTENWEVDKNVIRDSRLEARVESVAQGVARIGLTGHLKMDHWFYHKPDGKYVETNVIGYADVDARSRKLLRFNVVTDGGVYRGAGQDLPFGVAVRMMR